MILININGPAKSGKDALCQELKNLISGPGHEVVHMEFKALLFDIAIRAAGISEKLWFALYEREYKEKPCPYLQINGDNVSPRDWMIHCSESVMKPTFGKDVFGKAFSEKLRDIKNKKRNQNQELVVVVSDGGFIEEAIPVVDVVGPDDYFLIRLHRLREDGTEYDFAGDSRRYIYSDEFPHGSRPYSTDIWNDEGDIKGTARKVSDFITYIRG